MSPCYTVLLILVVNFLRFGNPYKKLKQCGSGPTNCLSMSVRPYEGSCSTPSNPKCGSAGSEYARLMPARNGPGGEGYPLTSSGKPFPNPDWISEKLFPVKDTSDPRYTLAVMQYGQIVKHDLGFTLIPPDPLRCCSKKNQFIPESSMGQCDVLNVSQSAFYQACHSPCMSFTRTYNSQQQGCVSLKGNTEKLNQVSSPLDMHIIYGISNTTNNLGNGQLRTYEGGRLKTEIRNNQEWLPNTPANTTGTCVSVENGPLCYLGGDPRMNQNSQLVIIELIYLREHNRIARELEKLNPRWNDEKIFQTARQIIIAIHQHITFYELLPVYVPIKRLYENRILYKSKGFVNDYNPSVCPATITESAHAAFRDFHSLVRDKLELRTDNRTLVGSILIYDWYNDPVIVELKFSELAIGLFTQEVGASGIFHARGMNERLLPRCVQETGKLAPTCLSCGLNMKAIDIQRGRDHGLPSYNDMREYCGFKRAENWEDFNDHIKDTKIEKLKEVYENVDDVELVPAGTYEERLEDSLTGPVFMCILKIQFYRTRVGDPFWYENKLGGLTKIQLKEIRKATISKLICNNANNVTKMQPQGFRTISQSNELTPCSKLPAIDLSKWKEGRKKRQECKSKHFFKYIS